MYVEGNQQEGVRVIAQEAYRKQRKKYSEYGPIQG